MSPEQRCPMCNRPEATKEDWDRYGEGEGEHLCWEPGLCGHPRVEEERDDLRSKLAASESEAGRLRTVLKAARDAIYEFAWEDPRVGRTQRARDALDRIDALLPSEPKGVK